MAPDSGGGMMCARSSFFAPVWLCTGAGRLPIPSITATTTATHATLRCPRLMDASCRRATFARPPKVVKPRTQNSLDSFRCRRCVAIRRHRRTQIHGAALVRALTRVATPETEERLLAVGRAGTAEHVERIVRGWRRVDRIAEARETTKRHRGRALHVVQDEDGMGVIQGRLEPEARAVLIKA